jgi:inner membrane protein
METVAASLWQKSKLIIKGIMILALVLLLLIPAYFVKDVISEREQRQKEAVAEVSSKWSGPQTVVGPVLVIPYTETITAAGGGSSTVRHYAHFLPDKLDIRCNVSPEKRYRGIYEVMLYSSQITLSGRFTPLPLEKVEILNSSIMWDEAYVSMGITDTRGLKNEMQINWNDSAITLNPPPSTTAGASDLFTAPLHLTATDAAEEMRFSSVIRLNGSERLLFSPVGKETTVEMESTWPDPSFSGSQLPVASDISKGGFSATWKSLSHTRRFPQYWIDDAYNAGLHATNSIAQESFGADLFVPVSGYQKTMRSVKYAILCILLTFAAFFIIETVNKKSVHPVQYALIGLALILFYTLLLSFSEYTGFNAAYIIATVATISLIAWFVKDLLQSGRLTAVLSVVLVLMYSYVFTILQLQDYSLLLGSIGLFLTLGIVMHFSKKIKW